MVCPGGGLLPPHPHFQSAASAASKNGFIFRKLVQNTFFHEWAPYRRWGGHRTAEIQVVAMLIFFIPIISQKKSVFRPVVVSLVKNTFFIQYMFLRSKCKHTLNILLFSKPPDACSRTQCMHENFVHAQESCACTRFLCMHKILVHAQDSCACTRILCMHKILVHAQESCACTSVA